MSKFSHCQTRKCRKNAVRSVVCAAGLTVLMYTPFAGAYEYSDGDTNITIDTSISHGVSLRVGKRDDTVVDINSDDGDLNYGRGIISNTSKVTLETEFTNDNFGAFARFQGFMDFENQKHMRDRTRLSDEALDKIDEDFNVLDLYFTGAFDAGDVPVDFRVGKHVLNWGESLFIQNGINVINPFDVSKLRKPGAELRDGLLPVTMASVTVSPTYDLSIEGFYQFTWEETEIDPSGTYFSVNDYLSPGGNRAFLTLPGVKVSDQGGGLPVPPALLEAINADLRGFKVEHPPKSGTFVSHPLPVQARFHPDFLTVSRTTAVEPDDSGQVGIALRYYSEALNDTEFGFYYINHHSRLPLGSGVYGTLDGLQAGLAAAGAITAPTSKTVMGVTQFVTNQVVTQVKEQVRAQVVANLPAGPPPDPATIEALVNDKMATQKVRRKIATEVESEVRDQLVNLAKLIAIDRYGRTARYFVEYPEDLEVFGISFNTLLGNTGWSLQGEYSFKPDTPLQRDEDVLFEEGLGPIVEGLTAASQGQKLSKEALDKLGKVIPGYITKDVSQAQVSGIRVFGPVMGRTVCLLLLRLQSRMFITSQTQNWRISLQPVEMQRRMPRRSATVWLPGSITTTL